MKNWILTLVLIAIYSTSFAQSFEKPDEGAQIHLSAYDVSLASSDQVKLDIWVVRSNKAKKAKLDAPKMLGAESLDIMIDQDPQNLDHYIATVKSSNLEEGKYFYTVSSRSRSIQKVKGTTISFTVGGASTAVTKNE